MLHRPLLHALQCDWQRAKRYAFCHVVFTSRAAVSWVAAEWQAAGLEQANACHDQNPERENIQGECQRRAVSLSISRVELKLPTTAQNQRRCWHRELLPLSALGAGARTTVQSEQRACACARVVYFYSVLQTLRQLRTACLRAAWHSA